ncbi:beta-lactamase family protein [Xylariaceae sp. FL1651]|nr:beta-lactamase family protein [Xylariaceae sp. FL1651]
MEYFHSDKFASLVRSLMEEHRVPGLAIGIVQGDETATAGYGVTCVETSEPVTGDTLFDVASCAKSLTAAAVGLLVEDNDRYPEVQYHATMSSLIPEDFVMSSVEHTEGVTIDDLLGHRTGMAGHNDSLMGQRAANPDGARSVTRNLRNLLAAAPLRARHLYCNMMYTVATHLVEAKTGQRFSGFLEDRILRPLNMSSTALQPSGAKAKGLSDRVATGHYWDKVSSTHTIIPAQECPESQGAGHVFSSANDFIKWVKALLRREAPITKKIYAGLVRLRSIVNPGGTRLKALTSPAFYAAGMEIYYYRGHAVVGHNGSSGGFVSRFFFLPDLGAGGVVLANSSEAAPAVNAACRELIDEAVGVPLEERLSGKRTVKAPVRSAKGNLGKRLGKGNPLNEQFGKKGGHKSLRPQIAAKGSPQSVMINCQPEVKDSQPQITPLSAYVGRYSHAGYHTVAVEVKDDKLFIDATDRSLGFTLTFEHIRDERVYTAHLWDMHEGGDDLVPAEFVFEGEHAVRLGLKLEQSIKEFIWFELEPT